MHFHSLIVELRRFHIVKPLIINYTKYKLISFEKVRIQFLTLSSCYFRHGIRGSEEHLCGLSKIIIDNYRISDNSRNFK